MPLDTVDEATTPVTEQDQTNPLHILQQEIANMPAVDAERVKAVLKKLESGELDILGTEAERLESAKRIAQKIMNESTISPQKDR